ncbi:methyltransferase domain-containing protein [Geodermatophilus sp. YIM 151500]|uniref:class I SAM-dependent methyltransferase n=1 Tax=Geodermatophilus sp. YIM 151500 TaxID=2984531 RepID=UPI0021E4E85E|nr:methyltransferase domain-containing protein [Geodermatophilus sp. YIM 151500]MCV2490779.1 methyltransferase domain-containing protein [Geodermatophilus sp. YIM 151500]
MIHRARPAAPRSGAPLDTASVGYTDRLARLAGASWKQRLDVQRPYRWNIRRLNLGRALDLGCGLGRNLAHLDGNGVGIDHNPTSVRTARERGFTAFTPEEFRASPHARPGAHDSLLVAHVVEHVPHETAVALLRDHLPYVRPGGKVVLICPQERGWASDATHIRFVDFTGLAGLCREVGLPVERSFSFPFPRWAGRVFTYNEFVVVARVPRAPR